MRRGSRRIVPAALAGLAFAAISGFFVARFPVRPELAPVSAVFVLLFAAPSYLALIRLVGRRRGTLTLLLLGLYALCIETVAVKTGLPYGRFTYGSKIGGLLFDAVPWTVFFTWTPLVLWALTIQDGKRPPVQAGAFLTIADTCLDPGAVAQGFWRYDAGGTYYGVPLSNFLGWLLTGTIGGWLALRLTRLESAPLSLAFSGLLSLTFWTSVCLFSGLWVPALIGALLVGGTLWKKS